MRLLIMYIILGCILRATFVIFGWQRDRWVWWLNSGREVYITSVAFRSNQHSHPGYRRARHEPFDNLSHRSQWAQMFNSLFIIRIYSRLYPRLLCSRFLLLLPSQTRSGTTVIFQLRACFYSTSVPCCISHFIWSAVEWIPIYFNTLRIQAVSLPLRTCVETVQQSYQLYGIARGTRAWIRTKVYAHLWQYSAIFFRPTIKILVLKLSSFPHLQIYNTGIVVSFQLPKVAREARKKCFATCSKLNLACTILLTPRLKRSFHTSLQIAHLRW